MDISIYFEEAAQVVVAFVIGGIVGMEREFRNKAAGFRTMILICVGSCLYTIISKDAALGNTDRIASNIVTGIGFIGAGVIFKEGITVNGLTTAALIWTTAALGMAIGYHNYPITLLVSGMVVIVLFVLEPVQRFINKFHKVKEYKIRTTGMSPTFRPQLEAFFNSNRLSFLRLKATKEDNEAIYLYRIKAPNRDYHMVDEYLFNNPEVKSFEA